MMTLPACALLTLAIITPQAADDTNTSVWYDLRPVISATVDREVDIDLRLHVSSSFIDALERDRDRDPLFIPRAPTSR